MLSKLKSATKMFLYQRGFHLSKIQSDYPAIPNLLDPTGVELLADAAFQDSCRAIAGLTLLDLPRLGNLWQFCQMSNPEGNIIEVGSYKGGGALHLSNSAPQRAIFVCDSFEGFDSLHKDLDENFSMSMFKDTREESVRALFTARQRKAVVVKGFFPASCQNIDMGRISFAHIDVDIYQATLDTLRFLSPLMMPQSFMILDDFRRRAKGVDQALSEFIAHDKMWRLMPLFPSQALLIHASWFNE